MVLSFIHVFQLIYLFKAMGILDFTANESGLFQGASFQPGKLNQYNPTIYQENCNMGDEDDGDNVSK